MSQENITSFRKLSHLEICLREDISAHTATGTKDFHFIHRAICDMAMEEIDTRVNVWGKTLSLPLVVAAMTGGHPDVRGINEKIARAVAKWNIAMGVGSERAAIEKDVSYIAESFAVVRDLAPDAVLIGNLGAAQFGHSYRFGSEQVQKAIDLIRADALAIHVNPAQEVVQIEGDTDFRNCFATICNIASHSKTPIILKEVGSGFCKEDAVLVANSDLTGIDVGGLGGTSWVGVEAIRAKQKKNRLYMEIGKTFWDWGIPTAISVAECRSAMPRKTIIATGGVRSGLDAAVLIALGADVVGMALPFLQSAQQGEDELEYLLQKFQKELQITMFLTGCKTIQDLRKIPLVATGTSREWLQARNLDVNMSWRNLC